MARARKRVNPVVYFLLMILAAALIVGAVIFTVYKSGLRYITINTGEHGVIKFIGRVDGSGDPVSGNVYFADGSTGELERQSDGGSGNGQAGLCFKLTYSNGDVYVGELDHFLRHGQGTLSYQGGDVYEGSFSYDEIDGYGVYAYIGGDVYTGDFVNGRKTGSGTYVWSADREGKYDEYVGEFRDDRRTGKGKYTYANGNVYEGDFVNDVKSGKGKLIFASGDVYEGDFIADVRTGEGTYTWASGESYTGQFLENKITGYGTYYWISEGKRQNYEGYFDNGKIVYVEEGEGGE